MTVRMIDADALEREGWSLSRTFQKDKGTMVYEVKKLSDFPIIEERKTGKWIDMGDFEQCSACTGTRLKAFNTLYGKAIWIKSAYCPNCGAKMIPIGRRRRMSSGKDINVPSNDLISRQAAIDAIERNAYRHTYVDQIVDIIRDLPSAQQEIIRCKDCKFRDEEYRRIAVRWLPCMDMTTGSNWFCGSAERRSDG